MERQSTAQSLNNILALVNIHFAATAAARVLYKKKTIPDTATAYLSLPRASGFGSAHSIPDYNKRDGTPRFNIST